jgi:transmembrane sensor
MTQSSIKRAAAKWLIELDTAENIEEHWPAFEAWLDEKPENRAAFASMERAWRAVEDLKVFHLQRKTLDTDPLLTRQLNSSVFRRSWWSPWVVSAAVVLLAFAIGVALWRSVKLTPAAVEAATWDSYTTDYGERKSAQLADGSKVELNTNTKLLVNRASRGREVVLDQGEALFAVEHDPDHPFLVRMGASSVQSLGTTFSVWRKSDSESVTLVKEGRVRVTSPAYPPQVVLAQHAATVSASGVRVEELDPEKVERKFSWTNGKLSFKGETLEEIVAEFNRYNRTKLKIDDPLIAQRRIGGIFAASDPKGFAELLEHTFGIRYVLEAPDRSQVQVIHLSSANH